MVILDFEKRFEMESLNALFEYATEGIIISERSGRIIKANPSSEKLFGYEPGELPGRMIEDLVPRKYAASHVKDRDAYNEKPRARAMGKNMDLYARRKDGSEFPVEISLSYYKQNEEAFAIAFIIDITERKAHGQSVLQLNQDLEKKVDERTKVLHEALIELENSREKLSVALSNEKELNDMKSRFVTMASHEFRTPLSTILSSISLVSKYAEGNEKIDKHVTRIKSAVTNMTMILNDFLSAEKLDTGKVLLRKEDFDLQILTNEILNEIHGILKKDQNVKYLHEGTTEIRTDKQMVRNILLNLISNAIKFSPEGKNIDVTNSVSESAITIRVKDQGIGIPAEERDHLFEKFFRAKNVTNIQGTGLGLHIVVKYLEALGGTIECETTINKGTLFTVTIPNI